MRAHRSLGVLLWSLATSASAAGNTLVYDNVGGWTIRTDADRDYSCHAEAEYLGGSILRVDFHSTTGVFALSIGDPTWESVEPGMSYRIELAFDDAPPWKFDAEGLAFDTDLAQPGVGLAIDGEMSSRFTQALTQRNTLAVRYEDLELDPLTLSLADSHRAMAMLEECQATMAQRGGRPIGL